MIRAEGCSWREPLGVGDADFSRSGMSSALGTNFQWGSLKGRPQMPAFGMSWRSSSLLGTTTLVTKVAFHPMPRTQWIRFLPAPPMPSLCPGLPSFEWLTRPLGSTMPLSGTCSVGFSNTKFLLTKYRIPMCQSCTNLHLESYIFGSLTFKQSRNPPPQSEKTDEASTA